MKKKLILVTILVLSICCLCLTACDNSSQTNYEGSATVTFSFDKKYNDIQISCPKAKITKASDTKYILSLESLAPVEVVVSAEDKEPQTFYFTYEDLKDGEEEKAITFSDVKYRMEVKFSDDKVTPQVLNDNITIEKVGEIYEIVSNKRVKEDVTVSFGEEYHNSIIPASLFKYSLGTNGTIGNIITVLKKTEGKVVVSSECSVSLTALSSKKNYTIDENSSQVVEIDDYIVSRDGNLNEVIANIKKEDLLANPYYLLIFDKLTIKSDNIANIKASDGKNFIEKYKYISTENGGKNVTTDIYTPNKFAEGQIISFNMYEGNNNYHSEEYLYRLTAEDISTKTLDITRDKVTRKEDRDISYIDVKFNWQDKNGNAINLKTATYLGDNVSGVHKYYNYDDIDFYELIDNNGIRYTIDCSSLREYVSNNIQLGDNTAGYYTIPVTIVPVSIKTVKFVDSNTKAVIHEIKDVKLKDFDCLPVNSRLLLDKGYLITDKNVLKEKYSEMYNLIFIGKNYPNDIEISVERKYSVHLIIANMDILDGNEVDFKCKELNKVYYIANKGDVNPVGVDFDFVESQIGKSYYFATEGYQTYGNYEGYHFTVTLTEEMKNSGSADITIVGEINEWQDVEFGDPNFPGKF